MHVPSVTLFSLSDAATAGHALATEEVRYGARVAVVVLPAHPLLRTPEALAVVGPGAFGYEGVEYRPVGAFRDHTPPYSYSSFLAPLNLPNVC
jgi:DUF917 family protein